MKKIVPAIFLLWALVIAASAQVVDSKIIDNGSSGRYKAIASREATLPDYVVYRPQDLKAASKAEGKLPVVVFANGGCSNTSITHEKVLSEIASHGYVVVAIGALIRDMSERERKNTEATMLTAAIDWITAQSKDKKSEYYNQVNLDKVASAGQSCGGAQVLVVAKDPRIKTSIMFNSGIGDMSMAGANQEMLKTLHSPIIYIVGGESDVATKNAEMDYARISKVPVAFANLLEGGHMGTFGTEYGGSFAKMALDWLDWQLKGKKDKAALFLRSDLAKYPGWTMKVKNF